MAVFRGVWGGVCLAAGLLLLAAPAAADYTITQTSSNGLTSASSAFQRGQSFTTLAGHRGQITRVDFQSDTLNNDCTDFSLRIYAGDRSPDNPSAALYTESFTGFAGEWKEMTLSAPVPVDPSTQYTWEIKASNCSTLSLRMNTTNPYSGGRSWSNGSPLSGLDYAFRVYVDEPTVSVDDLNGDAFAYTEGDGAVIIDQTTAALVADSDSTGYIGGVLSAVITSGGVATEDQLSFDTSGAVALAGTTAGSEVSVGGVVVGNLRNDIDVGNDLVVILNGNATDALLTTLVEAITYENTNTFDPTTGTRDVSVTLSDASPRITEVDFQTDTLNNNCSDFHLRIYAGNRSPDNPSAALYTESFTGVAGEWKQLVLSTPVSVAPSTQYTWEIKGYNCSTISLRMDSSNPYSGGNGWSDGHSLAGTDYPFHVSIETNGVDYTIDQPFSTGLYGAAASVQRGQSFTTLNYSGSDTSIPSIVTITVAAVNDAPAVSNLGGDVLAYTEGDGARVVDQGALAGVVDDGPDYSGGNLTAAITAGGDATEDVLSFVTGGSVTLGGTTAGSTVSVGGVTIGRLANSIGVGNVLVVNLNASATDSQVAALVQAITYENANTFDPTTTTRTLQVTVTDGAAGVSPVAAVLITVAAVNDAPVVSNLGGDVLAYIEGDGPRVLDQGALSGVVDDGPDYSGGNLTAAITAGGDATEDILSFVTGGSVTLGGTTAGSTVSVSGIAIGTLGGNIVEGNTLVVALNTSATDADVTALVQAISYEDSDTLDPTTTTRTLQVTMTDGAAGVSPAAAVTVTVAAVNDAPVVANFDGDVSTLTTSDGTVFVDVGGDAGVTDSDSTDFDGGYLLVVQTSGVANGLFGFGGTVTSGGDGDIAPGEAVAVGGTVIGTVDPTLDGQYGRDLRIALGAQATPARMATLLENLTYSAHAYSGTRVFQLTIDDGDGTANGGASSVAATFTLELALVEPIPTATPLGLLLLILGIGVLALRRLRGIA